MKPVTITDDNFDCLVLQSEKLSVVDFWATWCAPCIAMHPTIDALAQEYEGKVQVGSMNLDNNIQISLRYAITSVPCILFLKNGTILEKQVGAISKSALDKKIQFHLGK